MKPNRRWTLVLAVLLGPLVSGCHTGGEGWVSEGWRNQPVPVFVQNNNFLEVTVYARASGSDLRLGDVGGKGSGRFTINPRTLPIVSGLQLRVDPLGSDETYLSPQVFPTRGGEVFLFVGAHLDQSSITIR